MVCFFLLLGLMPLWVLCLGFENTWAVSKKWNVSRVISRLYGSVYKILRLLLTAVEYSIVVADTNSIPSLAVWLLPVFDSRIAKFVFRSSGDIKFCDPS